MAHKDFPPGTKVKHEYAGNGVVISDEEASKYYISSYRSGIVWIRFKRFESPRYSNPDNLIVLGRPSSCSLCKSPSESDYLCSACRKQLYG